MMPRSMLTLSWILALMMVFASSSAQAERIEAPILLEAQNRLVTILYQEPGEPDEIRIDDLAFPITSVDPAGVPGRFNYNGQRDTESVAILQDQILLGRMKNDPFLFSRALKLRNADEVNCPPEANALLMVVRLPNVERVGNCTRLERR